MFRTILSIVTVILLFTGCQNTNNSSNTGTSASETEDLTGYIIEDLGNGITRAYKKAVGNIITEEGYLYNGKKHGAWVMYTGEGKPESVISYVNGEIYGPELYMNTRLQITRFMQKKGGQPDGLDATYKNGRPVEVYQFKDGQLHGTQKFYFQSGREVGKLQRDVSYKNGKMDGLMRYYDPDGNITLKYTYKNGKKVDGGIVE
jgi:antitoxin component YwqK of YwqJK toxin-antitoxin module